MVKTRHRTMTHLLRLLAFTFAACSLPAQNPLAADPFAGVYQNDQMKLELIRSGPDYTGVIAFGPDSLPVKAKPLGGKLTGTFQSGGQSYTFQASRTGTQLSFVTDGTTHTLEKVAKPTPSAPKPTAPAAAPTAAPPIVGEWHSRTGNVRIGADGTAAIGDKTHRWTLEGNVITFAGAGNESIKVPFELNGDIWTWKFPDGQLVLTRAAAGTTQPTSPVQAIVGSWQGPNGAAQINPDGTALVGGVSYRYTLTGDQLKLFGPDGTFVATVQTAGDSMTWLINGKTLNFQRAASTWTLNGAAANGVLPELIGKWCQATNLNNNTGAYSRSTCFTLLADGSYQYAADFDATGQIPAGAYGANAANSDSGTWTATADSITSRSKKTGVRTFRLEKRNNPKTGDPMLVLDGDEFTTAYKKEPWR